MCAPSTAPSMPKTILRKSFARIVVFRSLARKRRRVVEVHDDPPPVSLLIHVAFPSLGREGLSVCQLGSERPIVHGPCDVTGDGDREVVWLQAPLGESLLQEVDVEAVPDALPALEPAEWRHHGKIGALRPDLR